MTARTLWYTLARVLTLLLPDVLLRRVGGMNTAESRQAWREKILGCFLWLLLTALVGGGTYAAIQLTCQKVRAPVIPLARFESNPQQLALQNGILFDVQLVGDKDTKTPVFAAFAGQDASNAVPLFLQLQQRTVNGIAGADRDDDIRRCVQTRTAAAEAFVAQRIQDPKLYEFRAGQILNCTLPTTNAKVRCYSSRASRTSLNGASKAELGLTRAQVAQHNDLANQDVYVVIRNRVYDIGKYLSIVGQDAKTSFFPEDFKNILASQPGGDISLSVDGLANQTDMIKCMDKLFFAGRLVPAGFLDGLTDLSVVADSFSDTCGLVNPVLYAVYGLVFLVLLAKSVLGLGLLAGLNWEPISKLSDAYVAVLISTYAEPRHILQKCIDSVATGNFRKDRLLLVIVCDGMVCDTQSGEYTYKNALEILGYQGPEPEPKTYSSSKDDGSFNLAKCYAGTYFGPNQDSAGVAYVVIVKVGVSGEEEGETPPGNRGKKDSQLLLWRFLQSIESPSVGRISPFDYELYNLIAQRLFIDPARLEYCLSLDADTHVSRLTVQRLVSFMDSNPQSTIAFAQTRPANGMANPLTALQVYPMYLSHALKFRMDSLFGTLTWVPGNCSLYRMRNIEKGPIMTSSRFLNAYVQTRTDTMHLRNAYGLAEDRSLVLALRAVYPEHRVNYVPCATCYTQLPTGFMSIVRQKIRWNVVNFHLRWESFLSPNTTFRQKLVAFVDAMSMWLMPAFTVGLYILAAMVVMERSISSKLFVIMAFVGLMVLHMLQRLTRLQIGFLVYVPWFMLVGVPLYFVVLPIASIWSWNAFQWTDTFAAKSFPSKRPLPSEGDQPVGDVPKFTLGQWQSRPVHDPVVKTNRQNTMLTVVTEFPKVVDVRSPMAQHVELPVPFATTVPVMQDRASTVHLQEVAMRLEESMDALSPSDDYTWQLTGSMYTVKPLPAQPAPFQATNFYKDALEAPSVQRGKSIAGRSDFSATTGAVTNYGTHRSTMSRTTMQTTMTMDSDELEELSGGLTKAELREEINDLLADADLNTITRREVKEQLYAVFGEAIEYYTEFIHACIEEYTLDKLAL